MVAYRRKRYARKGVDTSKNVKKYVQKYVKRKLHEDIEDKVIYGNVVDTIIDTGDLAILNGIGSGSDIGERVGNRIRMVDIDCKAFVQNNLTLAPAWVRVALVYDTQSNGALPSTTQLLYTTAAGATYTSGWNINGEKRYRILYDQVKFLRVHSSTGVFDGTNDGVMFHIKKKLNLETVYNSPNVGIEAINTGALLLFYMSNTDGECQMHYDVVIRYEDA